MSYIMASLTGNYNIKVHSIKSTEYENRKEHCIKFSLYNGILSSNHDLTLFQWPEDCWSGNDVHCGEWTLLKPSEARAYAAYFGLRKPQVDEPL